MIREREIFMRAAAAFLELVPAGFITLAHPVLVLAQDTPQSFIETLANYEEWESFPIKTQNSSATLRLVTTCYASGRGEIQVGLIAGGVDEDVEPNIHLKLDVRINRGVATVGSISLEDDIDQEIPSYFSHHKGGLVLATGVGYIITLMEKVGQQIKTLQAWPVMRYCGSRVFESVDYDYPGREKTETERSEELEG